MKRNNAGNMSCFAMGCLGAIATVVIVGVVLTGVMYFTFDRMVKRYTETEPMELPPVALAESDFPPLQSRVEAFFDAVDAGEPVPPMTLTADEINAMLLYHPDLDGLGEYVRIGLSEGQVRADISFPLDRLNYRGRYLNGSGVFDVYVRNGLLHIYGLSFEIRGEEVPQQFMEMYRRENLLAFLDPDRETEEMTEGIRQIELGDGWVTLVPARVPDGETAGAELEEAEV